MILSCVGFLRTFNHSTSSTMKPPVPFASSNLGEARAGRTVPVAVESRTWVEWASPPWTTMWRPGESVIRV